MRFLPRKVSIAKRIERSSGFKLLGGQSMICWRYPWKDINPNKIRIALAQKKPLLNWVEVFQPSTTPMTITMVPEIIATRMPLTIMRMIRNFIAFSFRSYSSSALLNSHAYELIRYLINSGLNTKWKPLIMLNRIMKFEKIIRWSSRCQGFRSPQNYAFW